VRSNYAEILVLAPRCEPGTEGRVCGVGEDQDDPLWDAFVSAMLAIAPLQERRSRFADKAALFLDGREIAHWEAPGLIDLRITHAGWSRAKDRFRDHPAVRKDPARRDWLELVRVSAADLDSLAPLLATAVESNRAGVT
jgi:hypothetical protein